ncbi:hypothetical protein CEUSTIGMA_g5093.t1 [Chlamydomonas eustigma]|uniref:Uncharacterized protein n=1 Tax=Chlamydomonas eustigma TaxID=1157962 RepID=A0A250X4G9_9CHLO|nr:hypothetical protein CEUSTIGMA_g5093.t1 [Chlamydomonas eustigma]|eukprot:GAX77650.1 hypothetical protein CEUSTIGMA_g5093.t1 [Chlamydomonas eustigma]
MLNNQHRVSMRRGMKPLKGQHRIRTFPVHAVASNSLVKRQMLTEEEMIARAREFVETGSGYFTAPRPELFSEDFVFRGPVIGPLNKRDYLISLDSFQMYNAFPDLNSNAFGFCLDPLEPGRIRFFVRQTGTHKGPLNLVDGFGSYEPTFRKANVGPEAYSMMLNEEGRVKLLNVGYPVDFDAPNTTANKYGAAFGLLQSVGISLPTGPAFGVVQKLTNGLKEFGIGSSARSVSKWEEIPQWYKEFCPRREGAEGVSF